MLIAAAAPTMAMNNMGFTIILITQRIKIFVGTVCLACIHDMVNLD